MHRHEESHWGLTCWPLQKQKLLLPGVASAATAHKFLVQNMSFAMTANLSLLRGLFCSLFLAGLALRETGKWLDTVWLQVVMSSAGLVYSLWDSVLVVMMW